MNKCEDNGMFFFGDYEPYRVNGMLNPKFEKKTGGYILDVKDNIDSGVNYYSNLIIEDFKKIRNLNEFDIILYVPSSKVDKISSGMERILRNLCKEFEGLKFNQCLKRIKDVPKKAYGGSRNTDLELKTIKIINSGCITNKKVILFDDVTTTGISLLASKEILESNGASKVVCIALGKTV